MVLLGKEFVTLMISTRGRYGLRSLADMVINAQDHPIPLREIAERQGISESYLEQVFAILRKAGLINAVRGSYGGYILARPAGEITVGEILQALEGPLVPVDCVKEDGAIHCDRKESCPTQSFWGRLAGKIGEVLSTTTLQDLTDPKGG